MSYLSNEERKKEFDQLADTLGIYTDWYDATKLARLSTYVMRTRTLYDANYVLVDLTATDFNREDILSAVKQLQKLCVARIIFIGADNDDTDIFLVHWPLQG